MKAALASFTVFSALLLATAAGAQVAGPWHVTGKIADTPFAVDCRFEPRGADFGGVCVEAATSDPKVKAGKVHTLSRGVVAGRQVQWVYPANFLLAKFDVSFNGTLENNQIVGMVSASGRKGEFRAVRR